MSGEGLTKKDRPNLTTTVASVSSSTVAWWNRSASVSLVATRTLLPTLVRTCHCGG